jgi:hypothetical protein
MQKKPKARMDEIELARSIFDEIVEETESEDWENKSRVSKNEPTRETENNSEQNQIRKEAA